MTTIIHERLEEVKSKPIKYGGHRDINEGCCVMEAASYIAGEPWSDAPQCVCPVIATFMRRWNDGLPSDEDRTRLLRPLLTRVIGTRSTPEVELARTMQVIDWLCRECLPEILCLAPSLVDCANKLRAAKPIRCWDDLDVLADTIQQAKKEAAAARAAARVDACVKDWDAAGGAAFDAACEAAWDAAWSAARNAAFNAAWDAARDAARAAACYADFDVCDAARAAAGDAAFNAVCYSALADSWDAINATTNKLQDSAVGLIKRLCAIR